MDAGALAAVAALFLLGGRKGSGAPAPEPDGAQIDLHALDTLKPAEPGAPGTDTDVAGDIRDDEPDLYDGEIGNGGPRKAWTGRGDWGRLMREPAERVRNTWLTKDDYRTALALLFGAVTLEGCPPNAAQAWGAAQREEAQRIAKAADVILGIAGAVMQIIGAIYPEFKALIEGLQKAADAIAEGVDGYATNDQRLAAAAKALENMQNQAHAAMQANAKGYLAEVAMRPVLQTNGVAFNEWFRIDGETGELVFMEWRAGDPAYGRAKFLQRLQAAMFQPPLAPHVSPDGSHHYYDTSNMRNLRWWSVACGCTMPLRARVNRRARIYRAAANICAMVFPFQKRAAFGGTGKPGEDVAGVELAREIFLYDPPALFSYVNLQAGVIVRGCVLAPHPDDGDIRPGRWYSSEAHALAAKEAIDRVKGQAVTGAYETEQTRAPASAQTPQETVAPAPAWLGELQPEQSVIRPRGTNPAPGAGDRGAVFGDQRYTGA